NSPCSLQVTLRHCVLKLFCLAMFAAACIRCQPGGEASPLMSQTFRIAEDSSVPHPQRQRAALRLNEQEKGLLRAVLLARVPGACDAAAASDVIVLGAVGDDQTAAELEK